MIIAQPGEDPEPVVPPEEAIADDPTSTPELVKRTSHGIEPDDMFGMGDE